MNKRLELTREQQIELKEAIKSFYLSQYDEEVSDLKSQLIFDFISETFAPMFYNLGIKDTVAFISDKLDDTYHLEL